MATHTHLLFLVVIFWVFCPVLLRRRREMLKGALPGEVDAMCQYSPVLVVFHGSKQGRGIVVRGIEHVHRFVFLDLIKF